MRTRFIPQAATVFDAMLAPFLASRIGGVHFHGPSTPIPPDAPLLLVANHVSWWDGFLLRALQKRLRPDAPLHTVMLERELAKNPWFRLMGCHGLVPGDRSSWERVMDSIFAALRERPDGCVAFFPQGRIWPAQKRPLGFRKGIVQLAERLPRAVVLPVALRFEPLNTLSPHAFVTTGEPILAASMQDHRPRRWEELVEAVLDRQAAHLDRHGEQAGIRAPELPR